MWMIVLWSDFVVRMVKLVKIVVKLMMVSVEIDLLRSVVFLSVVMMGMV